MFMKHIGTAAAAAVLLSGGQALAATVVIDDFTTFQSVTDVPATGQNNSSTISGPASIGGTRTLEAQNTASGATADNATTLTAGDGKLAFSNNDGATGIGTLTYAGLNLMARLDSVFNFGDISFDNGFNLGFAAAAVDGDGTRISYAEELDGPFSANLTFAEFIQGDSLDDFDFDNIASLIFTVDSTGRSTRVDGSIGNITLTTADMSAVPVPAAGFLLVGALGGLAAMRRRRKS